MKQYKPQLTKSNSWEEIENWYQELIEHGIKFEPMLELIKHIRDSDLQKRIYAYTSVHKLVVGIYGEIEWNREALHIEFDTETRKWFFTYQSKPSEPIKFKKIYNEELGITKFNQFINLIKW